MIHRLKKIILIGALSSFCSLTYAKDQFDVYGTTPSRAKHLLKVYSSAIHNIEAPLLDFNLHTREPLTRTQEKKYQQLLEKKQQLTEHIQHQEHLAYVNISTTYYPELPDLYTTLNIITNPHDPALALIVSPKTTPTASSPAHDLIEKMQEFEQLTTQLMMQHQLSLTIDDTTCPAFHCILTFNHPRLKPYLHRFNQGAIQQRAHILHTLQHDPDPARRAAAVFLIAHFKSAHEVINTLMPHVFDPDPSVRNNVMRVLSSTLEKEPNISCDVRPFIPMLRSPFNTDRNKALSLLFQLAHQPAVQQQLIQEASEPLLALLRLKQPNQHESAYVLLKKISGKNYGEEDWRTWDAWRLNAIKPRIENPRTTLSPAQGAV